MRDDIIGCYRLATLGYYKLEDRVQDLEFATEGSACFDIRAHFNLFTKINKYLKSGTKVGTVVSDGKINTITITPGDRVLVPTGLILDIPKFYSVRLHPRSGTAYKKGLTLANCEGVIDSDYVDPLFVLLYNISDIPVVIEDGERIAQAELVKNPKFIFHETKVRPARKTDRDGGFGSTGTK